VVLSQKLDLQICDFDEAVLRDGRTSDVSTGVPEKLCFRLAFTNAGQDEMKAEALCVTA